ncbi:MAG TPA: TolC family protein [Candidatus Polarisedimenticolia bacterium]|nr:TolC family protein [Candidatus Polarisedimenticolia bacterium]
MTRPAMSRAGGSLLGGFILAFSLVSAAPPDASAPVADEPLTLEEALRLGEAASPALVSAEAQVREAQGLLTQAGLYPNPDLVLDAVRFTNGDGPKETVLSLRQPLPWGSGREAARAEATERLAAAERTREQIRCDLLLEVRSAWMRAAFAAAIAEVKEEDLQAARELRQGAEARVTAGDAPPFEGRKAAIESSRAEAQAVRARGDRGAETASLNLLLGRAAETPARFLAPEGPTAPEQALDDLVAQALASEPRLQAAEHRAEAAARGAERARVERRPLIAVGPTIGREEGESYAGLGVAFRLPLWDRNKGGIAAAEAARDAAKSDVEAERLQTTRTVAETWHRFRAARDQQALLTGDLLKDAETMLDLARQAYRAGETGLLDYLDARRTVLALREESLRARLEAALQAARLTRALGSDARPETP